MPPIIVVAVRVPRARLWSRVPAIVRHWERFGVPRLWVNRNWMRPVPAMVRAMVGDAAAGEQHEQGEPFHFGVSLSRDWISPSFSEQWHLPFGPTALISTTRPPSMRIAR
jgi:hypothetical protein